MGRAKGLLEIAGQPILIWLLDRFRWPGPTLLVTAPGREHPPGWERFDREAADHVAGEGPLRGIHTALEASATDTMIVTTVDMPGIGREPAEWLLAELAARPTAQAVMCLRRNGSLEPFPIAIRCDARTAIAERLAGNERSVEALAGAGLALALPCPPWPELVWANLNRPQDLEAWMSDSLPGGSTDDIL